MADDVTVRLLSGKFDSGAGGLHTEGDTFDVAESTAGEHAELERVSDDESGGSDGEDASSAESLTDLEGVGDSTADALVEAGYGSVADVRSADADALAEAVDGIGTSLAESLTEG